MWIKMLLTANGGFNTPVWQKSVAKYNLKRDKKKSKGHIYVYYLELRCCLKYKRRQSGVSRNFYYHHDQHYDVTRIKLVSGPLNLVHGSCENLSCPLIMTLSKNTF